MMSSPLTDMVLANHARKLKELQDELEAITRQLANFGITASGGGTHRGDDHTRQIELAGRREEEPRAAQVEGKSRVSPLEKTVTLTFADGGILIKPGVLRIDADHSRVVLYVWGHQQPLVHWDVRDIRVR